MRVFSKKKDFNVSSSQEEMRAEIVKEFADALWVEVVQMVDGRPSTLPIVFRMKDLPKKYLCDKVSFTGFFCTGDFDVLAEKEVVMRLHNDLVGRGEGNQKDFEPIASVRTEVGFEERKEILGIQKEDLKAVKKGMVVCPVCCSDVFRIKVFGNGPYMVCAGCSGVFEQDLTIGTPPGKKRSMAFGELFTKQGRPILDGLIGIEKNGKLFLDNGIKIVFPEGVLGKTEEPKGKSAKKRKK